VARNPDISFADALQLARTEAETAIRLDSTLAEAYSALGKVLLNSYRLQDAEKAFKHALSLDSKLTIVNEHLVWLYVFMGSPEAALARGQVAVKSDALSPSATVELARALMVNGRCDEALVKVAVLDKLEPPLLRAAPIAAQCYAEQKNFAKTIEVLRASSGRGPYGDALLASFLARSGQRDEAIGIRDALLAEALKDGGHSFPAALAYAGLGDFDNAFSWLDRSVGDYSLFFPVMEPAYRELRADSRFGRVARRVGIEHW
jgi:tetratricopeptide (TPR) repeat protein